MAHVQKTQIDEMRDYLHDQGLLEFMVQAIKGDVINNQRLSLRDRAHLAAKLSNKLLPDLKATEQKTTIDHQVNIRYEATAALNALCPRAPFDWSLPLWWMIRTCAPVSSFSASQFLTKALISLGEFSSPPAMARLRKSA